MEVALHPQPSSSSSSSSTATQRAQRGSHTHLYSSKNWETQHRSLPQGKWNVRRQRQPRQEMEAPSSWQMQHLWERHGGGWRQHRMSLGIPVCPHHEDPCHVLGGHQAKDTGPLIKQPLLSKCPTPTEMGRFESRRTWRLLAAGCQSIPRGCWPVQCGT